MFEFKTNSPSRKVAKNHQVAVDTVLGQRHGDLEEGRLPVAVVTVDAFAQHDVHRQHHLGQPVLLSSAHVSQDSIVQGLLQTRDEDTWQQTKSTWDSLSLCPPTTTCEHAENM